MEVSMKHATSLRSCFLIACALALLFATAAQAVDVNVTYTYDNAGRLTAVDYGNGRSIAYTYDDAGNILTITSSNTPVPYTLTVNKTGTGTGTVASDTGGINCGVTCSSPYAPDTVVTLTATPDSGSGFSGWNGCDTSSGNTCTVTMAASKIVSAAFSLVAAPGKTTLISPSGAISTNIPTYTWNALSNSASYLLYVNDNSGNKVNKWYSADQGGCSGGTGTCSVTPDIPLGGAARWWIQTWNSVGYGPWSNPLEFTAPSLLPGKVALVSPSGAIDTNVPAYTWNADAKSAWYWLYVNDSSGNKISQWYSATQAGCPAGTGTCTVAPGIALASGSGKYWVQTWNSNGSGLWSDGLGFTVPAPVMPGKATLVLPLGITTFNNWPAFTWNAASNTTWYYLWVDDINGNRIKKWYKAAEAGCSSGTGTCSVTPDTALADRFGQMVDPDLQ